MDFGTLLGQLALGPEGLCVSPPPSWRQGRTLYGGLSLALSMAAAERAFPGLPPLRAAQTAFIGPSAGEVLLQPQLLRRGRSMTFVGCDLMADAVLACRSLFAHGDRRESAHSVAAPPSPDVPPPAECPDFFHGFGPDFAVNFEVRKAGGQWPLSAAGDGELLAWVRHAAPAPPSTSSLLLLADALPPASFARFAAPAMISTITWSLELFSPERHLGEGWYLLHARDDGVGAGYAGQSMAMWDEAGTPVLGGRQSVALFA